MSFQLKIIYDFSIIMGSDRVLVQHCVSNKRCQFTRICNIDSESKYDHISPNIVCICQMFVVELVDNISPW